MLSPSTVKSPVGQGLDWRVFVRVLDNWSWGLRNRTIEYCCSLGFNSCYLKSKTSFAKWTHFSVTVKEWNQCQMFPLVGSVSSGKRGQYSVKFPGLNDYLLWASEYWLSYFKATASHECQILSSASQSLYLLALGYDTPLT